MTDYQKEMLSAACIVIFMVLFTVLLLSGCDGGWSIAGWEVK